MNILIVEEDQSTRLLLETWLREWGHHVTTNEMGKEAWELIKQTDFGLVFKGGVKVDQRCGVKGSHS